MTSIQSRRLSGPVLACFGCAALVSLSIGVRHALQYESHDLQWMGGRLLADHIDPWNEAISRYPHHLDHFSPPNYLHLLYLLFLPFVTLNFLSVEIGWCVVSIGFSIAAAALLRKAFDLDTFQMLMLLFLLWMSSPFRVVLEVGQMSLFELFFFILTFVAGSTWLSGTAFGISMVKYSFSPVAGMLFLLRGRIGALLIAACICIVGLLGVKLLLPTPLLHLASEPFLIARTAVSPGLADIMTFAEYALKPALGRPHASAIAYALAFVASLGYAIFLRRFRLSRQTELVLVSLASLLFFKHLLYDYIFLVIPLAYAFKLKETWAKVPIFAGVFIFWFLAAILARASTDDAVHLFALAINCALLLALFVHTTRVALRHPPA